jgi:8-oxo-dGTP pyrophosphatase MutT (NUDIX family)
MQQHHVHGVEVMGVRALRLVQAIAPQVPAEHRTARDAVWDAAVQANPNGLFDGPVVVCAGLERDGETVLLRWAQVTYRHFALRRVPNAVALPSIFVAVAQPTDEGGLLVGRMSATTAAPGRLQLPGGSVEPPADGTVLDTAALARHAARELVEEVGIVVAPEDLELWTLTRGEHGNIGVFFRAPSLPEQVVRGRFQTVRATEEAAGRVAELRNIVFPSSPLELSAMGGPQVDYLVPLLDLHNRTPVRATVTFTPHQLAVWYAGGYRTATAARMAGVQADSETALTALIRATADHEPWLPDHF